MPIVAFVTSNVVLSCLVWMAGILARLVQMTDSLSALQLTGVLFVKHTYPPPPLTPYLQPPPPLAKDEDRNIPQVKISIA